MIKLYLSVLSALVCTLLQAQVVTSVASGNWNTGSTWSTGTVPTGSSQVVINNGHTILVDAAASVGTINIHTGGTLNASYGMFLVSDSVVNAGTFNITGADTRVQGDAATGVTNTGTLNISAGYLQIGGNGFANSSFTNSGSFNMSNGDIHLYGNLLSTASSQFTQSGGYILVDGNAHGDVSKSVAAGTHIVSFLNPANQLSLTGNGTMYITDPHVSGSTETYTLYFNNTSISPITTSATYTLQFGDWTYSTDNGGSSKGFYVYANGNHTLNIGDIVLVGSAAGNNRHVTFEYPPIVYGNMLILNYADYRLTPSTVLRLYGNLTVAPGGTLTAPEVSFEGSNNQTVEMFGTLRNDAVAPTANFSTLTIAKTPGNSVSFDNNVSVSDMLSFDNGFMNMNGHTLTLGTGTAQTGSLGSTNSYMVNGKLKRWITAATGNYLFPIGTTDGRKTASFTFNTAPSAGGSLTAEWINIYGGINGLPITEGSLVVDSTSLEGYWHVTAADGLSTGNYNAAFTAVSSDGMAGVTDASRIVMLTRLSSGTPWTLNGTHITTTGATDSIVLKRNGVSGLADFGIGISTQAALPVTLISFAGKANPDRTISVGWKVSNQQGINQYVVEKSNNGREFIPVGSVNAVSLKNDYQFTDAAPFNGRNYYRLRIVEAQKISYSSIVLVSLNDKTELFVYPLPAKDVITLHHSAEAGSEATITDMHGKLMMRVQLTQSVLEINIAALPEGIYVLKIPGKAIRIIKQ